MSGEGDIQEENQGNNVPGKMMVLWVTPWTEQKGFYVGGRNDHNFDRYPEASKNLDLKNVGRDFTFLDKEYWEKRSNMRW